MVCDNFGQLLGWWTVSYVVYGRTITWKVAENSDMIDIDLTKTKEENNHRLSFEHYYFFFLSIMLLDKFK
jgi:hypothetical protein